MILRNRPSFRSSDHSLSCNPAPAPAQPEPASGPTKRLNCFLPFSASAQSAPAFGPPFGLTKRPSASRRGKVRTGVRPLPYSSIESDRFLPFPISAQLELSFGFALGLSKRSDLPAPLHTPLLGRRDRNRISNGPDALTSSRTRASAAIMRKPFPARRNEEEAAIRRPSGTGFPHPHRSASARNPTDNYARPFSGQQSRKWQQSGPEFGAMKPVPSIGAPCRVNGRSIRPLPPNRVRTEPAPAYCRSRETAAKNIRKSRKDGSKQDRPLRNGR